MGGVVAVFVISAILFYLHPHRSEGFESSVPADLNRAPIAAPNLSVPSSFQRPTGIPGPASTPRLAIATPKELQNLDGDIMVWLDAAGQLEREHPTALTPLQRQQRVLYQSRIRSLREQLGTGKIEDTSAQINKEMLELRDQNAVWSKPVTAIAAAAKFGSNKNPDTFLDPASYKEFRALFEAGINELKGYSLADPLQTVRLQQLQVTEQELKEIDRRSSIPIKFGAAQLFLKQMLQPSQPLPSLLSLDTQKSVGSGSRRHETDPANILPTLKDIQWTLTVQYNPGEQALLQSISEMIRHFESGKATPEDVIQAREEIVDLQNRRGPVPYSPDVEAPLSYNPDALIKRATRLCHEVREAFPDHGNAEALGCPKNQTHLDNFEAETIINTVCSRIRTSVPTVTPEQFNCPKPGHKHAV
jgi:hypothetical protein